MTIQIEPPVNSTGATNDYLQYFFLRMKRSGGLVATTSDPDGGFISASTMLSHGRGSQLFKFQAISVDSKYVHIINQGSQLALGIIPGANPSDNSIYLFTPNPNDKNQMWSVDAANHILLHDNAVISLVGNGDVFQLSPNLDSDSVEFEFLYPADFVYVRNCFTGRLLTSDVAGVVSWQMMSASLDDFQQWGITSDGFLVSRATAQVLQLSAATPSEGLALSTGTQVALGAGDAYQRFDVDQPDGTFHSIAGTDYVIASTDSGQAVITAYSATQFRQLVEFISPFQFFSLEGGLWFYGPQPWFGRAANIAAIGFSQTGNPDQWFTVSRYGELISRVDGYVLQSQGSREVPQFVDPAPDAIGFDSTTFVYNQLPSPYYNYGSITLRSGALGLIAVGGNPPAPWMHPLPAPDGSTAWWQLVGPPNSLFASYQELAIQFFSDPAPLPGEGEPHHEFGPELTELLARLSKTQKVVMAIIIGFLDLACGISIGTVGEVAAEQVVGLVLGDPEVAKKVGDVMDQKGTIGPMTIIAVPRAISTKLWLAILNKLLPRSFWGRTIMIMKLTVTIASWFIGLGAALTGFKLAQLGVKIAGILVESPEVAAAEVALLAEHVSRQVDGLAT